MDPIPSPSTVKVGNGGTETALLLTRCDSEHKTKGLRMPHINCSNALS